MSVEGEICAYVRGCRDKKFAITVAASLFGRSREQIVSALREYGLVDENGQYIEPARLTGKERLMEKGKRRINYPAFQWSKKRQRILSELYNDGATIPEIAEILSTDEITVRKGIEKYDLVPDSDEQTDEPDAAVHKDAVPAKSRDDSEIFTCRCVPDIHAPLKDILHSIVDAANHNNDTMESLLNGKENQACFELGQQCAKLSEAERAIKYLLSILPESVI